jgi:hypothetical protein
VSETPALSEEVAWRNLVYKWWVVVVAGSGSVPFDTRIKSIILKSLREFGVDLDESSLTPVRMGAYVTTASEVRSVAEIMARVIIQLPSEADSARMQERMRREIGDQERRVEGEEESRVEEESVPNPSGGGQKRKAKAYVEGECGRIMARNAVRALAGRVEAMHEGTEQQLAPLLEVYEMIVQPGEISIPQTGFKEWVERVDSSESLSCWRKFWGLECPTPLLGGQETLSLLSTGFTGDPVDADAFLSYQSEADPIALRILRSRLTAADVTHDDAWALRHADPNYTLELLFVTKNQLTDVVRRIGCTLDRLFGFSAATRKAMKKLIVYVLDAPDCATSHLWSRREKIHYNSIQLVFFSEAWSRVMIAVKAPQGEYSGGIESIVDWVLERISREAELDPRRSMRTQREEAVKAARPDGTTARWTQASVQSSFSRDEYWCEPRQVQSLISHVQRHHTKDGSVVEKRKVLPAPGYPPLKIKKLGAICLRALTVKGCESQQCEFHCSNQKFARSNQSVEWLSAARLIFMSEGPKGLIYRDEVLRWANELAIDKGWTINMHRRGKSGK